ncbi:MAG: 1-deoxy-D-xylulose-5-phosphate synthase N-terminal domain-containing protein, partial [Chlamydiales bacterium]
PMGCAELGAYLFGEFLRFDPAHPKWPYRDRLILSVGHGSLWLYSCLHLAGFPLTLDDLKNFRQIDSKTPSHPDLTKTEGVEATTGVDGQGVGYAVGQALGLKHLGIDSKVVVVAGDGDLMEGVAMESCSIAGHLCLNNLILIFDSNSTILDGYVHESFSENLPLRFQSQGWNVLSIDGHNLDQIRVVLTPLRTQQEKPTLIIAHTRIGHGAPNAQGTPAAHGSPLGKRR